MRMPHTPPAASRFHSGDGASVQIGKINQNQQICLGTRGKPGTDCRGKDPALAYAVFCLGCGTLYGTNEGAVWERKCPNENCSLYNDGAVKPPAVAAGIDF